MPPKRILITGSNGFLGSNLVNYFSLNKKYQVFSTSQKRSIYPTAKLFFQGDLTDEKFVRSLNTKIKPDIVINTVSLVNVDLCEERPDIAYDVTVRTAENIAREARRSNARLIYISTDHLFDGNKAWYTEEDSPDPVNMYGRTKLQAEEISRQYIPDACVIRTNFFGWSPKGHVPTFGEWMYTNLRRQIPMTLFNDYYFTPIEVTYLAESLEIILQSNFSGTLNIAGSEKCSKFDFGVTLAKIAGLDAKCVTQSQILYDSFKVRRPKNLALSTEKYRKIFGKMLPNINQSLERFMSTMPDKYK